jgi:zinc protease
MAPQRRVMVEPDLKKAYLVLGYHTVSLRHPDLYPLDVLSYILAKGTASRLVRVLRDEKKLVDAVGCWSQTPRYDAGSFVVSATLDPANLAAAEEAILAELEQVKTKPVTKAELAKAKAQVAAERVFDEERVEDKASALGSGEVSADDPQFNDRYVKGIQTVTATDVLRVAQEYFLPEGYTFCALTPSAASAQVAKAGAAPGAIQLRKLPDGAKLLVQPSATVPLVTLSAVFAGGLRYETAESNGISELTSDLLVRGTKRRTREQLNRELESVGGSISPWVGRDSLGLTVQVLKQDFGRGLEVLADAIENSTFPPEELETVRKLQLASIAAEQDDAFSPTFRLLFEQLFSAHPYRFQKVGTAESVAKLTREQVVAYYHLICRPGNMILCVFGDVGADEAEAAATEAFRSFPAQPTEPAQPPPEAPLTTVRALTKERPQEQAVLVWGFRGMMAGDPDRYALDVMDAAFSGMGMPGGRLHETLRGQALVYATHLVTYSLTDPGFIIMYAATAPDKVEKTEQAVTKLVADLRQAPMSPEEIERGQTMCVAHHELGLQSNSARALTAALDELRGLGYDQFLKYSERIEKVTAAEVQRVAQQYLTLDACAYVKTLPAKQRP